MLKAVSYTHLDVYKRQVHVQTLSVPGVASTVSCALLRDCSICICVRPHTNGLPSSRVRTAKHTVNQVLLFVVNTGLKLSELFHSLFFMVTSTDRIDAMTIAATAVKYMLVVGEEIVEELGNGSRLSKVNDSKVWIRRIQATR